MRSEGCKACQARKKRDAAEREPAAGMMETAYEEDEGRDRYVCFVVNW